MANESKTQILELFGTLEWAKVFEHNRDRAVWNEEKEGEYKVTIIMDDENTEKFKESGCGKALVAVDGGNKVTFARPHKGKFEWQGGAPKVANIKGQPWDFETDGYIGNGSTGLINISLFSAGGRTGSRLEAVQVVDHVEFESEGGSGSSSNFRDLSNLMTKTDIKPKKKAAPSVAVDDDTIPF